ncbi:hypothetical protein C8R44DRAFT_741705 [Mycena epipterygia]|nr:hypothetical protein C8R44DRAFT_741705 [Mycena epipterygia]
MPGSTGTSSFLPSFSPAESYYYDSGAEGITSTSSGRRRWKFLSGSRLFEPGPSHAPDATDPKLLFARTFSPAFKLQPFDFIASHPLPPSVICSHRCSWTTSIGGPQSFCACTGFGLQFISHWINLPPGHGRINCFNDLVADGPHLQRIDAKITMSSRAHPFDSGPSHPLVFEVFVFSPLIPVFFHRDTYN